MREFETSNPNWQQQVESATFFDGRKGDMTEGTTFKVYTRPGIDFVVKIPKDPSFMQGYWLTEELAPELAVPFLRVKNLRLKLNGRTTPSDEAVVQSKVVPLIDAVPEAFRMHDLERARNLMVDMAKQDHALAQKGIFVPDPTVVNSGVNKENSVKRFDFGDARISFTNGDKEYSNLVRGRGGSRFYNYLFLKMLERNYSPDNSIVSDHYAEVAGVPTELHRAFPALEYFQGKIDPRYASYDPESALIFARIGHEEYAQRSHGAPYPLNEDVIRNLPQVFKKWLQQ